MSALGADHRGQVEQLLGRALLPEELVRVDTFAALAELLRVRRMLGPHFMC